MESICIPILWQACMCVWTYIVRRVFMVLATITQTMWMAISPNTTTANARMNGMESRVIRAHHNVSTRLKEI